MLKTKKWAAFVIVTAAVWGLALTTWAKEVKVVLVQVRNESKEDIFVVVDTGRIGDKVEPDKVKTKEGKDAPKGLIITAGAQKSFGECLGLLDAPTLHAWKVKDGVLTEDKDFSNAKFAPTDYIKIKIPPQEVEVPALNVKFDGSFKKQ